MISRFVSTLFFILVTVLGAAAESPPIKIGLTLPLSGRLAYVGKDIREGVQLAVKEAEDVRFETIFEDNQHQAALAVGTAKKLLDIDKVDVLVSLWDMADPIAPLAEKAKVPHLSIRWNPHIAERFDYTFTVESTYKSYVDKLVELFKAKHLTKVALLTEEGEGWILASDYLHELAKTNGIEIVAEERYQSEVADFRALVLRILRKKPKIVLLLSNPPNTEILTKRIREANPDQELTGYFEYTESPELYEGVIFVSQFAAAPWFDAKFRKEYGHTFKARAPQAYDIINLITKAQTNSSSNVLGDELIEALSKMHDVDGAAGKLIFSSKRVIESECVYKTFSNGKLQTVDISNIRAG